MDFIRYGNKDLNFVSLNSGELRSSDPAASRGELTAILQNCDQLAGSFVKRFDRRCLVDVPTLLAGYARVARHRCVAVSER
jgi:hypothetical protein